MGCKFSKKGSCRFCKKCKDRKTGEAEISETHPIIHASQEASECMESQPPTGTGKDIEQATTETLRPEDTEEALSSLQTVQSCDAQASVQSTEQAFQDNGAQPAAEMKQETGEAEPNAKITQGRQHVAQTPKGNESQYAAEIPAEGAEDRLTQLDAEIKQSPEAWHIKQDCQPVSCITEDHIGQSALAAMQEAGLMETTVQATAEIAEVQPTVDHMQETHQHTGGTQTPQEREAVSETDQETGEDQAAAQGALNTGEDKPTPPHPPETQPAQKSLQGTEIQTSAQATKRAGETQPALETEQLLAAESELEAGETQPAGDRTRETEAYPAADGAQESRAHPVTQDRELAACTTEATKQTELALQTAPEGQAQTTACATGENWPAQATVGTDLPAKTRETGTQGPLGTQLTTQTMEAPQGTTAVMEPMADVSMGPVEPKASQESPLEPVTVPVEQTTAKPQPTAQVTPAYCSGQPTAQVMAKPQPTAQVTPHPAQIPGLQEKQSDMDSQSGCALAAYKETPGNASLPGEEDQASELVATEAAKPELQPNVVQVAPSPKLSVSDAPESLVAKSQLLACSIPKACKSEGEEGETPRPPENQVSEGEMAPASDPTAISDTGLTSEETQQTEVTDSMSEPYNLCRRTCCT